VSRRGRRPVAPALALVAALVGACQPGGPSGTPGGGPGSSLADASPSSGVPSTLGPPPSPTPPDETTAVILDPTVLEYLPASVGGVAVTEDPSEATNALAEPSIQTIASAVDAGVAVDTGSGDLVYAWVVRLRPGVFNDEAYRQWRTSYDEGACSGGGMIGPAEATIDERTVFITTCTQGLRTYHVWLEEQDILISASAIGDAKFGEQLMDNLRVPGASAS
jgi:hypothetical protein